MLAAAVLFAIGCAGTRPERPGGSVVPLPNRGVAALDADDVVRVLLRAGLEEEHVLDLGTEFRNAIASHGSARIIVARNTEVIAAVVDDHLHVSSRTAGSFVYELKTPADEE